ncbi:hypothetical protein CONCODRAFT_86186 [Conidiobolus coronatus NRRL 28638]|uniref:Uncharacterized protein n=1 Tax=Conidiobolus coronatus (strain ATCC 28846 / CBS 209.66 / NRRL 28638) TaxID=796925 RepID=A0A137P296_CONC2|nr:hypothetical protein CONCODRAFT_86186 [Conidiobolus coronatus NRRL 28638]|eukprot:KXN69011.1 hypothetical protein CONCODRAFT_86186 [Conidiobolus coronatus NRRL 28638]
MSIDNRESNLLEVSSLGNLKAVQQYIMGGVNPNCQHPMNKWTPLHWAVKRGHLPIVQFLLDNGSDPKLKNDKGQTPLDLAIPSDIRALFKKVDQQDEKKTKFIPRYLAEPDLLKVWGLPDDAVFNQDDNIQSNQTQKAEEKQVSQASIPTVQQVPETPKKVEIIVFSEKSDKSLEIIGSIPILPQRRLTDLLVSINEDLQVNFEPNFKLFKYDKVEELRIPINQKQIYYSIEELFLLGNNKYYLIIKN